MIAAFAALALAAQGAPPPPPVDPEPIVVTAPRGSVPATRPDAVDILRSQCFDPARRTGHPIPPAAGPDWTALDETARRQFHVEDPAVPALAMEDAARDQQVWLKVEALRRPEALVEQRCTLLVIGGRDHRRFVAGLSKLFGGPPTQRHVGQRDGAPAIAGWEQWLWTGMPRRGVARWTAIDQPRGAPPTWLVVSDARRFYDDYDFIMADMKLRTGPGKAVTMLTFSVTTRDR